MRSRLLVLGVAAAVALAASPQLRGKVLDLLFGVEEEFDYKAMTRPTEGVAAGATVVGASRPPGEGVDEQGDWGVP